MKKDEVHEVLPLRFTQVQFEQPQKLRDRLRRRYDLEQVEVAGIVFLKKR